MPMDNPLYGSESNTCAGKLVGFMEPPKGVEELVGILHIKSNPIVANEEYRFFILNR